MLFSKNNYFINHIPLNNDYTAVHEIFFNFHIIYNKLNFKTLYLFTTNNLLTSFIFFKRKNFNKLYIQNKYLFLTPGIVLKHNNLFKKNLKNKTNTWNLFFIFLSKLKNYQHVFMLKNFFFNLTKILRCLVKLNLLTSLIYINLFTKRFFFKKNTVRRIKKWVKKKYFKVQI